MTDNIIKSFVQGPIENNTYLVYDPLTLNAVVIDPSLDCQPLLSFARAEKLTIREVWCTHAHFDHTIGLKPILAESLEPMHILLHPADVLLWQSGGGADKFGYRNFDNPLPDILVEDGQSLSPGKTSWQVLHTPGHTPGCVVYYCPALKAAFCGDTIFYHSVGRTDLPGSSQTDLFHSIRTKIFSLPRETVLYPGHGAQTTVAEELSSNPFVSPE